MEDVLEVYHRPYDPKRPVICADETSKQLVKHIHTPINAGPGQLKCEDDQYERCGTANIFLAVEPLTGTTVLEVTDHRKRVDYAHFLRDLCDVKYAEAEKIVLVTDNLNIHGLASLYEAFAPEEARRLVEKIEVHFTPKHGSWLNMAEIELSVLARQCLDQRIESLAKLQLETHAWRVEHNATSRRISWQFTTSDARIKLRRLYPSPVP